MSKYKEFMKITISNKIKKCKEMYKYLPKNHGTIIAINDILTELEKIGKSDDMSLDSKVYLLNKLRSDINPKKIFKNRFILQDNLKFCDEVNYTVAWFQDYYKGLLNKQNLLEARINVNNLSNK